ncbi:MFS transporter [Maricaulis sp.]|uniref:MFS transporter n=1 Tax=Maricaulis sp. TaxID=1486257 RepID=UPI001B15AB08|nr:MFS transporter [Maricaulis sp.]MBO6798296.1 MFS transporter [Maricaulis sp.]
MSTAHFFTDKAFANNRSLIAAICCAAVCGIVFGLSMPLISLRLEEMTGSGLMVGLNGAAAALSTLVIAPLVPRLMALLAPRRLLVLSLVGAAGLFTLLPVFPVVLMWFLLRFLIGCFMTVIFVISESWINQIVSPDRRALMLGVYGTALSGGFGIGGLLFSALHGAGDTAFYLGAFIFLAGTLPILFLEGPQATAPDAESTSLSSLIKTAMIAPSAILAGLAFGATETLLYSMLPVYGKNIGLEHTMIGLMVLAVALGAIVFQLPIGWVADRTSRRLTLLWIAVIATFASVLAGFAGNNTLLLLPILFVQSGVVSGLYTVGLSLLGERFTGGAIATANATFIFAYGVGSLVGPPTAGLAMDAVGPWGLLAVLAGITGAYVIVVSLRTVFGGAKS